MYVFDILINETLNGDIMRKHVNELVDELKTYEYFQKKNEEALSQFLLYGNTYAVPEDNQTDDLPQRRHDDELYLLEPSKKGDEIAEASHAKLYVYRKKTISSYGGVIDGIDGNHEICVVTRSEVDDQGKEHDEEYVTTIWSTSPENIREAVREGLIEPKALQSPIAKVLACYGQYRKIINEREVERELISNPTAKKLKIVDFAQDSISELINIYSSINKYEESQDVNKNIGLINNRFKELDTKLDLILSRFSNDPEMGDIFKKGIQQLKDNLNTYYDLFNNPLAGKSDSEKEFIVKDFLRPFGNPEKGCILHLIQDQLELINATARKANNEISGFFDGGDLFKHIVEAEIAVRRIPEKVDYHNPPPPEWSLFFDHDINPTKKDDHSKQAAFESKRSDGTHTVSVDKEEGAKKKEKIFVMDFGKYGSEISDPLDLARQIHTLDKIERRKEPKPPKTPNEDMFGVSWSDISLKSMGRSLLRGTLGLIATPFDLLEGVSVGLIFEPIYDNIVRPIGKFFGKNLGPWNYHYLSEWFENRLVPYDPKSRAYREAELTRGIFDLHKKEDFKWGNIRNWFNSKFYPTPIAHIHKHSITRGGVAFLRRQVGKLLVQPLMALWSSITVDIPAGIKKIHYDNVIGSKAIKDDDVIQILMKGYKSRREKEALQEAACAKLIADFNRKHPEPDQRVLKFDEVEEHFHEPSEGSQLSGEVAGTHQSTLESSTDEDQRRESKEQKSDGISISPRSPRTDSAIPMRSPNGVKKHWAVAPYAMNIDDPHDALSGSIGGYQVVMEVFLDEIYGKHRVRGKVFTLAAVAGGLPMFMASLPAKYTFIHTYLNSISVPIAQCLVGHTSGFMASFSTALIEGKVTFLAMDIIARGPSGIVANLVKDAVEAPIVTIAAVGLAVGLGYLIADVVDIPWLSEHLAEEACGTFPWVELGFAGAKIAALLAEGLIDLREKEDLAVGEPSQRFRNLQDRIYNELKAAYILHKKYSSENELKTEDLKEIEDSKEKYVQWMRNSFHSESVKKLVDEFLRVRDGQVIEADKLQRDKEARSFIEDARADVHNRDGAKRFKTEVNDKFLSPEGLQKADDRLRRRLIRGLVNRLEKEDLSEEERYKIVHWAEQTYSDSPKYADALRGAYDLDIDEENGGPLFVSIKMTLRITWWLFLGVCPLAAPAVFLWKACFGETGEAIRFGKRFYGDLAKKIAADFGLLTKALYTIVKYAYHMTKTIAWSAISGVALAASLPFIILEANYKFWKDEVGLDGPLGIVATPLTLLLFPVYNSFIAWGKSIEFVHRKLGGGWLAAVPAFILGTLLLPVAIPFQLFNGSKFSRNAKDTKSFAFFKGASDVVMTLFNYAPEFVALTIMFPFALASTLFVGAVGAINLLLWPITAPIEYGIRWALGKPNSLQDQSWYKAQGLRSAVGTVISFFGSGFEKLTGSSVFKFFAQSKFFTRTLEWVTGKLRSNAKHMNVKLASAALSAKEGRIERIEVAAERSKEQQRISESLAAKQKQQISEKNKQAPYVFTHQIYGSQPEMDLKSVDTSIFGFKDDMEQKDKEIKAQDKEKGSDNGASSPKQMDEKTSSSVAQDKETISLKQPVEPDALPIRPTAVASGVEFLRQQEEDKEIDRTKNYGRDSRMIHIFKHSFDRYFNYGKPYSGFFTHGPRAWTSDGFFITNNRRQQKIDEANKIRRAIEDLSSKSEHNDFNFDNVIDAISTAITKIGLIRSAGDLKPASFEKQLDTVLGVIIVKINQEKFTQTQRKHYKNRILSLIEKIYSASKLVGEDQHSPASKDDADDATFLDLPLASATELDGQSPDATPSSRTLGLAHEKPRDEAAPRSRLRDATERLSVVPEQHQEQDGGHVSTITISV